MARHIDADEVLNAMDTWPKYGIKPDGCFILLDKETENDYVPYVHYEDVLTVVNGTPTADVKSDVHAHWIRRKCEWGYLGRNCSMCGYLDLLEKVGNYCPNCGAKMDEEVD